MKKKSLNARSIALAVLGIASLLFAIEVIIMILAEKIGVGPFFIICLFEYKVITEIIDSMTE